MTINKKLTSLSTLLSFSLINKQPNISEVLLEKDSKIIESQLESNQIESEELTIESEKLQKLIDELNQFKVYILITSSNEEPKQELLLSILPEAHLDNEESIIEYRTRKLILAPSVPPKKRRLGYLKKNRFARVEMLRANFYHIFAKIYKKPTFYSSDNSSGYKGICPIFFDETSAQNFLIKSARRTVYLLRNFKIRTLREFAVGILNSEIKKIGLGNLIDYYSKEENKEVLNEIEFIFIPELSKFNNYSRAEKKKINLLLKNKDFSYYYKKFKEIREDSAIVLEE
jgi:hypothetical protein|uniref:Unidentified reading frame 1 n=1 Tax=Vaucheria litorea TaxID=109269 RepID=B7T1R4_VAULI|nr:unidentified reading frame 1 [Vaucheria litorea]ACF70880.1 unidentified reading frame 1 [Vaucheria litorea]